VRRETPKTKSNLKLSAWQCLKKCVCRDAPWRNAIASGICRLCPQKNMPQKRRLERAFCEAARAATAAERLADA